MGTVTASDQDGDPFAFSMDAPSATSPFVVTPGGQVVVAGPLDFETTASYTLTVSVNETGSSRNCPLSSSAAVGF